MYLYIYIYISKMVQRNFQLLVYMYPIWTLLISKRDGTSLLEWKCYKNHGINAASYAISSIKQGFLLKSMKTFPNTITLGGNICQIECKPIRGCFMMIHYSSF